MPARRHVRLSLTLCAMVIFLADFVVSRDVRALGLVMLAGSHALFGSDEHR